jgi:hypothetical protein
MLKVQISVTHGRGLATLYGFYNIFIQDKGQSRKEAGAEGWQANLRAANVQELLLSLHQALQQQSVHYTNG